jgi:hypothetical protein
MQAATKDDSLRDKGLPSGEGERSRHCDRTAVDRETHPSEANSQDLFHPIGRWERLYTIWLEVRNLVSRIAILRNNNWFRYGICLQSGEERCVYSRQVAHRYQLARMRGIQRLLANHPAATVVDLHILLTTIHPSLFGEDQRREVESQHTGDSRDTSEREQRTRTYPRSESAALNS